jgi:hypothetical protein
MNLTLSQVIYPGGVCVCFRPHPQPGDVSSDGTWVF